MITHYPTERTVFYQDDLSMGQADTLEQVDEMFTEWVEEHLPVNTVITQVAEADGPGEWYMTYRIGGDQ